MRVKLVVTDHISVNDERFWIITDTIRNKNYLYAKDCFINLETDHTNSPNKSLHRRVKSAGTGRSTRQALGEITLWMSFITEYSKIVSHSFSWRHELIWSSLTIHLNLTCLINQWSRFVIIFLWVTLCPTKSSYCSTHECPKSSRESSKSGMWCQRLATEATAASSLETFRSRAC